MKIVVIQPVNMLFRNPGWYILCITGLQRSERKVEEQRLRRQKLHHPALLSMVSAVCSPTQLKHKKTVNITLGSVPYFD